MGNELGGLIMPWFNTIINRWSNLDHENLDFQMARELYPGEGYCNYQIPHAKWHVEAGIAALDMIKVAQDLDLMLAKALSTSLSK